MNVTRSPSATVWLADIPVMVGFTGGSGEKNVFDCCAYVATTFTWNKGELQFVSLMFAVLC